MSSGKQIQRVLAMDCETSGINWKAARSDCDESIARGFQSVSWGLVVADTKDYKPIDERYVEIKWNGESRWEPKAEEVHGLSKEYLEENGMDEEEAIIEMVEFIMEYFDITKPLYCLGHNVASFDIPFFRNLLYRHEVGGIRFAQRHFDTFSLSMGTVKMHDSNDLFHKVGLNTREAHNSLEDAKYSLESFRRINLAWEQMAKRK